MPPMTYDAIVVGSGISGGWAAKELTEKGLRTIVLEAGRPIDPAVDYVEHVLPWEKRYRDMGVARVVTTLPPEPADKTLPVLDRWADLIRRVNA